MVQAYQAALKTRREGDDLGMLLQIAMVLWRHLNDLDQAEEYFRRIRKIEPAHPAAIDFYRKAFGATEKFRLTEPSGRIGHAELDFGGVTLMLSDEYPECGIHGPRAAESASLD